MSSKDKTRQKLMGSMRKTKAAAGIGNETAPEPKSTPTVNAEPAKTEQPRKVAEPKATAPKATRRADPDPYSARGDVYQSARRVWPD